MLSFHPSGYVILLGWVMVMAILTALLEIQIEGRFGWAAKLPTWRIGPRWLRAVLNGKDLTGYHLYFTLTLLGLFHFPIVIMGWSWELELTILSCYFVYSVLFDYLWFAFNPEFGWARYSGDHIWWFRHWLGPFPVDYYVSLFLGGSFAALRGFLPHAPGEALLAGLALPVQHLLGWGLGLLGCVFLAWAATAVWGRGTPGITVNQSVRPDEPDGGAATTGATVTQAQTPEDPLEEEQRYTETIWLVQLGEIIFSVVLGLAFERFARTQLFSSQAKMAFGDNTLLRAPLIVLYIGTVITGLNWCFYVRREVAISFTFARLKLGITYLFFAALIGFTFFQIFDEVTPVFDQPKEEVISTSVDNAIRWMGLLIFLDLIGQNFFRRAVMQACVHHESRIDSFWRAWVGDFRYYFGVILPIKTIGLPAIYMIAFFPGAPFLPGSLRYPLLSMLGIDNPLTIALGFVFVNLAFEGYLRFGRMRIHRVRDAYVIDMNRRRVSA